MFAATKAFSTFGGALDLGDPYWANVTLLLRYNGSLFADASSYSHTVTTNGSVTTTTGPFTGTIGAVFNGNTDNYLQLADSAGWDFSTDDFTVETWIYLTSTGAIMTFISTYGGYLGWELQHREGGFVWGHNDSQPITARAYSTLNTWVHVAVTRQGTSMRMFFNGVQQGATVTNSDPIGNNNPLLIGKLLATLQPATGRLYDLRITKGVARYTSAFTAPTEPFLDY